MSTSDFLVALAPGIAFTSLGLSGLFGPPRLASSAGRWFQRIAGAITLLCGLLLLSHVLFAHFHTAE